MQFAIFLTLLLNQTHCTDIKQKHYTYTTFKIPFSARISDKEEIKDNKCLFVAFRFAATVEESALDLCYFIAKVGCRPGFLFQVWVYSRAKPLYANPSYTIFACSIVPSPPPKISCLSIHLSPQLVLSNTLSPSYSQSFLSCGHTPSHRALAPMALDSQKRSINLVGLSFMTIYSFTITNQLSNSFLLHFTASPCFNHCSQVIHLYRSYPLSLFLLQHILVGIKGLSCSPFAQSRFISFAFTRTLISSEAILSSITFSP